MGNTQLPKMPKYQTFSSTNPYATAFMSQFGSNFELNPFLTAQNKFIEQNVPKLYNQLLNPTFDNNPILQARKQAFSNQLNSLNKNAFENNIINPLAERNMLRSSLVNDLNKNLQEAQTSEIAKFNSEQISNISEETKSLVELLMNQYKTNSTYGQNTLSNAMKGSSDVNNFNLQAYDKALKQSVSKEEQYKQIAKLAAMLLI